MTSTFREEILEALRASRTVAETEEIRARLLEFRDAAGGPERSRWDRLLMVATHQRRENVARELYHSAVLLRAMIDRNEENLDDEEILDRVLAKLDEDVSRFKRFV